MIDIKIQAEVTVFALHFLLTLENGEGNTYEAKAYQNFYPKATTTF